MPITFELLALNKGGGDMLSDALVSRCLIQVQYSSGNIITVCVHSTQLLDAVNHVPISE